ncbi:MAG: zinc-binding dehydrogenase [bacterium]|nr:zinc-binding dehydrogenase [bacterium]
MRAIVVENPGGLDKLCLKDLATPVPGPEDVLIEVAYAACNWSDIQKREGVYPTPVAYPAVLGLEASGYIRQVGEKVEQLRVGDRVAAITGPHLLGGYAEFCCIHQNYVISLPQEFSLQIGAAFPVVSLTAYHLLYSAHQIQKGQTILVQSIGGGVGLMLLQLALGAGARVIGTVGSEQKGSRAREFGVHLVIDRSEEEFVEAVLAYTHGKGVDLVIDSLGGNTLKQSFDVLRPYGRVINIGEASGYPDFDIRAKLYERSTSLAGFEILHAQPGSKLWRHGVDTILDGLVSERLHLPVVACFALQDAGKAHELLQQRGVQGKVILSVSADA